MPTEKEREVLALLRGGYTLTEEDRRTVINELDPEGRAALRRIAKGEVEVDHPKLRGKAIIALGFDEKEPEKALNVLRGLVGSGEAVLQVRALRALGRLDPSNRAVRGWALGLVKDPATRPDVALAAARVVSKGGGAAVVQELRALRERMLPMVPNEKSPSIASLDRLITVATGRRLGPSKPPRPLDT